LVTVVRHPAPLDRNELCLIDSDALGSEKVHSIDRSTNRSTRSTCRRSNAARDDARRRRTRIASPSAAAAAAAAAAGGVHGGGGGGVRTRRKHTAQRYASPADGRALPRPGRAGTDGRDGERCAGDDADDALRRSRGAVGVDGVGERVRDRCEWRYNDDDDDGCVGIRSAAERFGIGIDAWESWKTTEEWWCRGCR